MTFDQNTEVRITRNLIRLEQGKEELLLANSYGLSLLYIQNGKEHIGRLLTSVAKPILMGSLRKAFPNDLKLIEALIDHRIILPSNSEEHNTNSIYRSTKKQTINKTKSISVYLLLSQSCNLGCVYCLNGIKTYKKNKSLKMTEHTAIMGITRCLDRIVSGGKLEIVFFGGEPLLNWDLAKKIIRYCEDELKKTHGDKTFHYHLTTNLARIPDDLIDWAKKFKITFLCDVDGPEHIHNSLRPYKNGDPSYKDITLNIKRLNEAGIKVALRSTITSLNQDYMLEIAELHKELGGSSSAFVPVNPINSDEDILPYAILPSPEAVTEGLLKVYNSKIWGISNLFPFSTYSSKVKGGSRTELGCGAPYGNTPVIDVNGDVYACIYLVGLSRFLIGNIFSNTYPDATVLNIMKNKLHVDNIEECRICPWRYLCSGGCPVMRLTVIDNPRADRTVLEYARKIKCDYTKKIYELLLWEKARNVTHNQ